MSREIKFRAWDNVENKMYSVGDEDNIQFYFNGLVIQADKFTNIKIDTGEDYEDDVHCERMEHLIYMQYTGLKDKHGKEIYEGDFVHIHIPIIGSEVTDFFGVVKFCEGAFWVDDNEDAIPLWSEINIPFIVGNIYENPELLGEIE